MSNLGKALYMIRRFSKNWIHHETTLYRYVVHYQNIRRLFTATVKIQVYPY